MSYDDERPVHVMKANRLLQAKLGTGSVDEKKVARGQKVIEENKVDFGPMALDLLAQMSAAIEKAYVYQPESRPRECIENIGACVMQLKGNGAMFNYPLISKLAGIMLDFIEAAGSLSDDALEICEANHMTIKHLVTNKVTGDGGETGAEMVNELQDACRRYFTRHKGGESFLAAHASNSVDAFVTGTDNPSPEEK